MKLEQVVHRIATDSEFAAAVAQDPAATLHRADIDLSEGEFQALLSALQARQDKQNQPVGRTWYEAAQSAGRRDDQLQGRTWYEAASGEQPGADQLQGRTWYESQPEAETT